MVVAEVTLEGRARTLLEPSRAGLGTSLGLDWGVLGRSWGRTGAGLGRTRAKGALALLSHFACPLAAVGGSSR